MNILTSSRTRRRLEQLLLESDFDFHRESSSRASHSLHAFAAKFPPQLPALLIQALTSPGEIVLDPMVGSGTTIVEAYQLGRKGIGIDIDPLAIAICRVKTTRLNLDLLLTAGLKILDRAARFMERRTSTARFLAKLPAENREFIDYWFTSSTQHEIAALTLAVGAEKDVRIADFLRLVLSSIVITKSGGVSLARDLAHSRPHKDRLKQPKSALEAYRIRLNRSMKGLEDLRESGNDSGILVEQGDCRRHIPVPDSSVDLIVTSPPYANAIDYMRAHKFSLVWFGKSISELTALRSEYIGSERIRRSLEAPLPHAVERVIRSVTRRDSRKASMLRQYFVDMRSAMAEMKRVLKEDKACVIVVGPSVMRGYRVDTHKCLGEIGLSLGFDLAGIARRKLDRNRRMMPARFGKNGQSSIERRMHEEYIVGLVRR